MSTKAEDRFSIEFLRECFDYRDGVLYWKERPAHHFARPLDHAGFLKKSAGQIAGRQEANGYLNVKMRIDGHAVCLTVHRIVWALHHGKWPEHTIDHINRNRKDNRIENLRDVTFAVNMLNRGRPNSTGITGVHPKDGKFAAQIRIGEQQVYLGLYPTTEAAVQARVIAEGEALAAVQKPRQARLVSLPLREMSEC